MTDIERDLEWLEVVVGEAGRGGAAFVRIRERLETLTEERDQAEAGRVGRYFEMVDRAERAEAERDDFVNRLSALAVRSTREEDRLREQRDKALAALREIGTMPFQDSTTRIIARRALAEIEGKEAG